MRPSWAFLTDAIINCVKPTGLSSLKDINVFLTSIRPFTRSLLNRPKPPLRVSCLLKTASKVGLSLAPIKLAKPLQRQLPAWYHAGVPPQMYRLKVASCLETKHRVHLVRNLLKVSKRLFQHDSGHRLHDQCSCKYCRRDRKKGCLHPQVLPPRTQHHRRHDPKIQSLYTP